jgi:FkbM family methyltransferase
MQQDAITCGVIDLLRRRRGQQRTAAQPPLPPGVLDCRIASNNYGAYAVPRSSAHRPAAQAILRGGVWEPETVELLLRSDPEADVVHAGTFFGDFLPALGRSRVAGARVHAFEPNSENYRCAQITVLLNGLDNVILTRAGLDATSGEGELAIQSPDGVALGGTSHLITVAESATGTTEPVPLVSLDDAVPVDRRVGVVQLDVEGHEQAALEGGLQLIRRCRPVLVLESPPPADWFALHLDDLHYRLTEKVSGNAVLVPG